ncbi:hypothetical protein GobsT_50330 [Gemmata obscuriglobus]|uniref:Uncharacterized protein n=1 Tax=Gemmata obscuriglobus TaxID=114 RepID=A0A2Z3GUU2_9BACT|nr:hypothetical protein [Gemmata obscuriglobus]AWM37058.1 hypothetical protein C1280_08505 [Gemmata obscuriglobus]QEG30230.1 hypothetical protein GobsT_50330 [Gemmata obscuriglobus]VTS09554.1 unnamed protein product [Gemmata obscuriglobus UQM 2246]
MSKSDFAAGAVAGFVLLTGLASAAYGLTRPNISDTEFYRFCLTHNIGLADCVIPESMSDKTNRTKAAP